MKIFTGSTAMVVITAALSCSPSPPPGKLTLLSQLEGITLNIEVQPVRTDANSFAPPSAEDRRSGRVKIVALVGFKGVGDSSPDGEDCPFVAAEATIRGKNVRFIESGGGSGQGLISIESYLCRPVSFESEPLTIATDETVTITLEDDSRTLTAAFTGLLLSHGARLASPMGGKATLRSEVQIAIPTGSSAVQSATLWQKRDDSFWGGFSVPVIAQTPELATVRLWPEAGGGLLRSGPHLLELIFGAQYANAVTCEGGWTCLATPYNLSRPLELDIIE